MLPIRPLLGVLLALGGSGAVRAGDAFDVNDCRACHDPAVGAIEKTPHHGVAGRCARCHGDVAAHLASELEKSEPGEVVRIGKLKAAEQSRVCLECHDRGHQAAWQGGVHQRRGLSCVNCHSVHGARSPAALLKTRRDSETCYTCHAQIRARQMRVSHHPVREGLMECASCHDPHASQPRMIAAAGVNEKCYECHADKRGPFVWEHSPARESCLNCHDPHGSNHRGLLTARQPFLCQRCHLNDGHPALRADLSTAAAKSVFSIGRSCSNCHRAVHGTNAPSGPNLGR